MKAASEGSTVIIGEADFDLAHYANNPHLQQDKLPLKNCDIDPNAFIEITIKTNSQEVLNAANRDNPMIGSDNNGGSDNHASPPSGYDQPALSRRLAANNQLGHIEERSSEDGFKEGIDRKEYLYQ